METSRHRSNQLIVLPDVNDNAPVIFPNDTSVHVPEDAAIGIPLEENLAFNATDADTSLNNNNQFQ